MPVIDFYREHKDTAPTQGSKHPITSGAVYDALLNYYLKTETYSKQEVNNLISLIKQFNYTSVQTLPTASADTMYCLYFVPSQDPTASNISEEYITVRSGSEGSYTYTWELIGNTAVPTISTDIEADATSDTKTTSPKAVKTFVENEIGLVDEVTAAALVDLDTRLTDGLAGIESLLSAI